MGWFVSYKENVIHWIRSQVYKTCLNSLKRDQVDPGPEEWRRWAEDRCRHSWRGRPSTATLRWRRDRQRRFLTSLLASSSASELWRACSSSRCEQIPFRIPCRQKAGKWQSFICISTVCNKYSFTSLLYNRISTHILSPKLAACAMAVFKLFIGQIIWKKIKHSRL